MPSIGTAWLAPKLSAFEAAHPDITVSLDLSVPPADFTTTPFDIAIRTGLGRWPGLSAIKLMSNLYAPLCAPARAELGSNSSSRIPPRDIEHKLRLPWPAKIRVFAANILV